MQADILVDIRLGKPQEGQTIRIAGRDWLVKVVHPECDEWDEWGSRTRVQRVTLADPQPMPGVPRNNLSGV